MDIGFSKTTKNTAKEALRAASYDPRKLALIYSGIAAGITFLFSVISYLLSREIDGTGGIAGMGLRSILSTVQSVLPIVTAVLIPFWDVGFLRACMGFARNEEVRPNTLTAGFRRFGPVFRLFLIRAILVVGIALIAMNLASVIFSLTPWSAPLMDIAEAIMEAGTFTEEIIAQMIPIMTPLYIIFFAVFAALAIPMFYRLRMSEFILMDKPMGALPALLFSHRFMRGNCWKLVRLDLSFWWFYALSLCSIAIGYLDVILPEFGVTLPVNADVAFFLCYSVYILCQIGLSWWAGSYVQTTYATAFDSFIPQAPDAPVEQPQ